ncbi:LD-carboxypeptidase [Vibrio sp. Of7-15]|uniref:S66 family peptidase n=1 Tax=Vibrio sp. Of7-15 TaxID=2724879 RepID=UPI001EF2DFF7|nr:S66 peptidase family protein [Vibrio sp. Of7-15]MCG7495488.1 LD-carboxypeptidase [Vibrio sp. Of7-15]
MIVPKGLKKGDTIGFFSPSSPATVFAPKRFERAKTFLKNKGFLLKEGKLTGNQDGYRSGSIQERAEELNSLIRDPNVRCIMSTIGGMNSNSLLPYIDYEALKRDPKIIIGYSDVTALLLGIYSKTGLVTFYGPALVASFGELPPFVDGTYDSFDELLCKPCSGLYQYELPQFWTDERIDWEIQDRAKEGYPNKCEFLGQGIIKGRVVGGNLNTMGGIWGSEYMPVIKKGDILFIEDSLLNAATVERSLSFLKINGVFDNVSAVILGKHELFDDQGTKRRPIDILLEVLNGQALPIVNDFDCCHTHPMLTLPLGVEVEINFDKEKVSLVQPWLQG